MWVLFILYSIIYINTLQLLVYNVHVRKFATFATKVLDLALAIGVKISNNKL